MLLHKAGVCQLIQAVPVREADKAGDDQGQQAENQKADQAGQQERRGYQQPFSPLFSPYRQIMFHANTSCG